MFQLKLNTNWFDDHVTEISFSAKTKFFKAKTRLYTTEDELIDFGERISDFSKSPNEPLIFELGTEGYYGKINGKITVFNSRGLFKLELEIIGPAEFPAEEGRSILQIYIWASELDEFAKNLKEIPRKSNFGITLENNEEIQNH